MTLKSLIVNSVAPEKSMGTSSLWTSRCLTMFIGRKNCHLQIKNLNLLFICILDLYQFYLTVALQESHRGQAYFFESHRGQAYFSSLPGVDIHSE